MGCGQRLLGLANPGKVSRPSLASLGSHQQTHLQSLAPGPERPGARRLGLSLLASLASATHSQLFQHLPSSVAVSPKQAGLDVLGSAASAARRWDATIALPDGYT